MAEYIEREELEKILETRYERLAAMRPDFYAGFMAATRIVEQEIPNADVEPVVHASWVNAEEKPYIRKHFHKKVCSNCFREGQERWKRCPYCEAKMDGKE